MELSLLIQNLAFLAMLIGGLSLLIFKYIFKWKIKESTINKIDERRGLKRWKKKLRSVMSNEI